MRTMMQQWTVLKLLEMPLSIKGKPKQYYISTIMKTTPSFLFTPQAYRKKIKKCQRNSSKIYYLKVSEKLTKK